MAESSFYVTGGTLRHDAPSYVERQADRDLLEGLLKGEFCYVLTSRQMGKSSLMVRTAGKLREQGVQVVVLDLTAIGQNLTPEQWYDGLLVRLGRQLDLEDELEEFWKTHRQLGPCQRLFAALSDVVLLTLAGGKVGKWESEKGENAASQPSTLDPRLSTSRLVFFVDELDVVRSLPFSTDEFFAAIRECYNRRAEDPEFQRLTFCLLGVATPSDLIRDTRITPFNIGRRIELNDFTPEEAAPLAEGLSFQSQVSSFKLSAGEPQTSQPSTLSSQPLLARILYWTNGHPYLTQRLCQAVAERSSRREALTGRPQLSTFTPQPNHQSLLTPAAMNPEQRAAWPPGQRVDHLCEQLFLSHRAQEKDDNLLFVRERLLRSEVDLAGLLTLYQQVFGGKRVRDDETNPLVSVLRLSGLTREVQRHLQVRNRIYDRVFDLAWVRANMPDAEVRRQREAFRRGVFRATAIAATIIALLAGSLFYARYQAHRADANAQAADQQRRLAEERLYLSDMNLAYQALYIGNLGRARNLLEAHRRDRPEFRNFEWRYLWRRCRGDYAYELAGHSNTVSQISWSRDETRLATRSLDDVLIVWNLAARRPELLLTNATSLGGFSPDGSSVAVGQAHDSVGFYNFRSGQIRRSIEHVGHLLTLLADGRSFVTMPSNHVVKFWDVATGSEKSEFRSPGRIATVFAEDTWGVEMTPDGTRLAIATVPDRLNENGFITIWDVARGQTIASLPQQHGRFCFTPDGQRLATGGSKGIVNLWSAVTNGESQLLQAHDATIRALAFSPNGQTLATGSSDQMIRLWDTMSGTNLDTLLGHENGIRCLAFSPDGKQMASGSRDETVKVWSLDRAPAPDMVADVAAEDTPNRLVFSHSGRMLAAGGSDRNLKVWESAYLREMASWPGEEVPLSFSADEHELLTFEYRNRKLLWRDIRNPTSRRTIDLQDALARQTIMLAYSIHANLLAIGDVQGAIHLWDASSGTKVATLSGPRGRIGAIAFSPDAKLLVSSTVVQQLSATLHFWDVPKRQLLGSVLAHRSYLDRLSFSPDGRVLASASGDNTVKLWDVNSRTVLGVLKGHRQPVFGVAFSLDGTRLASGSSDGTIKLWSVALQQEAVAIKYNEADRKGIDERIWLVEFSPDGGTLAAVTWDNRLKLWRAPPSTEINTAERIVTNQR